MLRFRLLAITLLLGSAGAVTAAERDVYELQVAGKTIEVTLGERFELALPGGRPFAILGRAPTVWTGHGIRFSHPGDMKVSVVDHRATAGVDMVGIGVTRDASLNVLMLFRPPEEKAPERAIADAVEGLKMAAKGAGVEMKTAPWRETVAGKPRKGVKLTATSGDDPACSGVLAISIAGRILVIGYRAPRSRQAEALAAFRTVATSLAVAKEGAKVEPKPGLELKIGDRTYAIELDRPTLIQGPDGKEFKATLRRGRKSYAGAGIEFEYPGDMKLTADDKPGRVMIRVEHGDTYLAMVQVFLLPGVTTENVLALSVKHIRSSVERTGARFGPEKTCRLRFLGKMRTGTRLVTEGGDDPYRIEIYSFEVGKRTIAVSFFCPESKLDAAKKAFQMIARTLGKNE